jgi:hypothetical protein
MIFIAAIKDIRYLGQYQTKVVKAIFGENNKPLLKDMKEDLNRHLCYCVILKTISPN